MVDHVDPYRLYLSHPSGQPDEDEPSSDNLSDYYGEEEEAAVCDELTRLFADSFRTQVYFGRRHYAASPTWRDELTTSTLEPETRPRFVVRTHVFERRGGHAGRYLGFVSLRPPGSVAVEKEAMARLAFRYIIDAELTPPAHMQRPRYHVVTTTASSARLGVLPFRSAVYSVPGLNRDRGSACVHLAVSQALHLVMGRFGCRPISHIEFDWHLWLAERTQLSGERPEEQTIQDMGQRGAGLQEALKVIETTCNGGGFLMVMEPRENRREEGMEDDKTRLSDSERATATRWLTDALASGLPVIAVVRAGNLLDTETRDEVGKFAKDHQDRLSAPHAVLLLGMHLLHSIEENGHGDGEEQLWDNRVDRAEIPGRVVLHDTLSRGPYFECMLSDFLNAAEQAFQGNSEAKAQGYAGVQFLVVGPKGLKMSLPAARHHGEKALKALLKAARYAARLGGGGEDIAAIISYLEAVGVTNEARFDPTEWSLICRLLNASEVRARYEKRPGLDVRGESFASLDQSYLWVVEVRHPKARRQPSNNHMAHPADLPPAVVFVWDAAKDGGQGSQGPEPRMVLRYKRVGGADA